MHDFLADFSADTEFLKLLTRHDQVDLPTAALELARDAYPGLDFQPTLRWIEERGGELRGPLARVTSDEAMLHVLGESLGERQGLVGRAECYDLPDSSYLHRVIELKTGLPIALSVLYMAVAERAGVSLLGVGAPIHFLTRYDTLDEPLFVDAYAGGQVLTFRQCLDRVQESSGLSEAEARAALEPVSHRTIILRMLNNLKALFARQTDWRACWQVQHRLLALRPGNYHERRDWALVSLQVGKAGSAMTMLESCLATCPDEERESLEEKLGEAKKMMAQWN
ncbi:MAG: SirB1 family protein [Planctomycetales bacterium]